jgi:hypothetical protein
MTVYRFYRLDAAGHILNREDVVCADDDAARLVVSTALKPLESADLWEGTRRVCTVSGTPSGATQMNAIYNKERPGRRSSPASSR